MNPSDDLEVKLRSLSLRSPDPAWKNEILDTVFAEAEKKRAGFLSLSAIPAWFAALKFRYRLGFGALAAVWMLTLYFHFSEPRPEALAIRGFDHMPNISAQEMFAALYYRNWLVEHWIGPFELRSEYEHNPQDLPRG